MNVKLDLVTEKKGFLDHFSYVKILLIFLVLFTVPTFFISSFSSSNSWHTSYCITLLILFLLSWIAMYLKYNTKYDFEPIGTLILSDDKITINSPIESHEIDLAKNKLKLLYNGVRGKGFHFGKDHPRSGIAEMIINDNSKYFVIIANNSDLEATKRVLKIWYKKKFNIEEFTRTTENYRLIELEANFEWARLKEINENK